MAAFAASQAHVAYFASREALSRWFFSPMWQFCKSASNASGCNSPYSWISVGSHSSSASGCNRPPSSNASGWNSS